MTELVWSWADTHCVWCGKPFDRAKRDLGDFQLHWGGECVGGMEAAAAGLRARLEVQVAVIEAAREAVEVFWDARYPGGGELWDALKRLDEALDVLRTGEASC